MTDHDTCITEGCTDPIDRNNDPSWTRCSSCHQAYKDGCKDTWNRVERNLLSVAKHGGGQP